MYLVVSVVVMETQISFSSSSSSSLFIWLDSSLPGSRGLGRTLLEVECVGLPVSPERLSPLPAPPATPAAPSLSSAPSQGVTSAETSVLLRVTVSLDLSLAGSAGDVAHWLLMAGGQGPKAAGDKAENSGPR